MRTAGNKAFTLIELMIVIMIIAILATLIVPSLIRAVELARQAACNANVQKIVIGLTQYSNASEEMPNVPVSSWDTAIGDENTRGIRPFAVAGGAKPAAVDRNHSANLWLLARGDHVSLAAFVCPATTDSPNEGERVKEYWDFESGLRISYGLQSPYGHGGSLSILTPENVVLVADGSPYVETYSGTIRANPNLVNWSDDTLDTEQKRLRGNSPNHDSEGQNVGYIDGHADWKTDANCGKNSDNIYTATGSETETSDEGNLTPGIKNNENDTLILP